MQPMNGNDKHDWARVAQAKVLAACHREAAFELARWALQLRGGR